MARQLVHGKRFFIEHFGIETKGVWLPDSFGYNAAYPQLAKLAGNEWFLTQKISWNQTNKFPHHTFWWEGIDGTRIFTHFPPVDTYNARFSGEEMDRARPQLPGEGRRHALAGPLRLGRRRWRPHPRDHGTRAPARRPGGLAQGRHRAPRRRSSPRPARSTRTPRSGTASCTWSCTAPPTPPRPAPSRATAAASTSCARPSCGRRRPRCTRRATRTRTRSSTGCGRRSCCTSSTTSCRAPRSPGCTARRRPNTPGWPRSWRR